MVFFKIGSTDLTDYVDIQNYDINREDEYESWTDANGYEHREVIRKRVSGSIALGFKTAASFASFNALMTSARQTGGYYAVTLYVNNTGATVTTNAFLDLSSEAKWDLTNSREWHVQTVTVKER